MVIQRKFIIIGTDDNRRLSFRRKCWNTYGTGKYFRGECDTKRLSETCCRMMRNGFPLPYHWTTYSHNMRKCSAVTDTNKRIPSPGKLSFSLRATPLFFGFANTVKRKLPDAEIKLYPSFNSLQTLAHRLVMPYDDMRTVSLTGRPWHDSTAP